MMNGWLIALLVIYVVRFFVALHNIDKGGYVQRRDMGTAGIIKTVVDVLLLFMAGVWVI